MLRLRLVLADADTGYVDKFIDFTNSTHSQQFKLSAFTQIDLLRNYIGETDDKIDILLAHPDFLREVLKNPDKVNIKIVLSDGANYHSSEAEAVYKYQPGTEIVRKIMEIYLKENNNPVGFSKKGKNTELISVYSPAGGTGKTSVSLGLAAALAEAGKDVLYLCMESLNTASSVLTCRNSDAFTHLLLCVSESPSLFPVKAEICKTRDNRYNFDFFEPPECFSETVEIKSALLEDLLASIKQMGRYDMVIVDMDTAADEKARVVFQKSDKIVLVTTQDSNSRIKTDIFMDQLEKAGFGKTVDFTGKVIRVVNKSTVKPGMIVKEAKEYCLPVVPELWTCQGSNHVFDIDGIFCENCFGLAEQLS
jgi:cellulose biosynthesis protein BcsQ